MSLQETIDQDIRTAMLEKNSVKLRGLRAIKAALLVAKTEKGASDTINSDTELKVLQKLVKQRRESAEIYQTQNRQDLYQVEQEELEVIEAYLPAQMSAEEIRTKIQEIIERTGANSMKDMGRVMASSNQELAGKADGRAISEIVKELLSK